MVFFLFIVSVGSYIKNDNKKKKWVNDQDVRSFHYSLMLPELNNKQIKTFKIS